MLYPKNFYPPPYFTVTEVIGANEKKDAAWTQTQWQQWTLDGQKLFYLVGRHKNTPWIFHQHSSHTRVIIFWKKRLWAFLAHLWKEQNIEGCTTNRPHELPIVRSAHINCIAIPFPKFGEMFYISLNSIQVFECTCWLKSCFILWHSLEHSMVRLGFWGTVSNTTEVLHSTINGTSEREVDN